MIDRPTPASGLLAAGASLLLAGASLAQEARYPFDGDLLDATANGNDPVVATDVTFGDGVEGTSAAVFNGTTSALQLNDGTFLNAAFTDRTVALAFNPSDLSGTRVLFDEGGNTHGLLVQIDNGALEVTVRQSTTVQDLAFTYAPAVDRWQHVAVTIAGTEARVYVNGNLAHKSTLVEGGLQAHSDDGGFGARYSGGSVSNRFAGRLDDARVYATAETPGNIAALASYLDVRLSCPEAGFVQFYGSQGNMAEVLFNTSPATYRSFGAVGDHFNAAGYNPTKGVFYGTAEDLGLLAFVDRHANVTVTNLAASSNNGDFNRTTNRVILGIGGKVLRAIDVDEFASDTLTFAGTGGVGVDVSHEPLVDKYFSFRQNQLYVLDPSDNSIGQFALTLPGGLSVGNAQGGSYVDDLGRYYVSDNASGGFWRITLDHGDYANSTAELIGIGRSGLNLNDGAMCTDFVVLLPREDRDDDDDGLTDFAEFGGPATATDFGYLVTTYGWPDAATDPAADADTDGVPNYADADFATANGFALNARGVITFLDADGDGYVNSGDLDADNDGVPDLVEAGGIDGDGDGLVDDLSDADRDGIPDAYDAYDNGGGGSEVTNGATLAHPDPDADGAPSTLDLDSDGDGIADLREQGGADADADGRVDDYDAVTGTFTYDDDGDPDNDIESNGLAASADPADGGTPRVTTSATGTSGAPASYLTGDHDADGLLNAADLDADGDGLTDATEADNPAFASAEPDSDGDGLPDFRDVDADGDGIVDLVEAQASAGALVPAGTDGDGDGVDDNFDATPAAFGAAGFTPLQSDADGVADYRDPDADDDGEPDAVEGHDPDNDGAPDAASQARDGVASGVDADGDGLDDGYDNDPAGYDPTNAYTAAAAPENDATNPEPDWRDDDANIAGYVWDDTDGDGIREAGEPGAAGAAVEIRNAADDALLVALATDANGYFLETEFAPGGGVTSYYVQFAAPAGLPEEVARDQGGDDRVDSDYNATTLRTDAFSVDNTSPSAFLGAGFRATALPVDLTDLAVRVGADCVAELTWSVAAEVDVAAYDVQYAPDGRAFASVASVPASGAPGYASAIERPGYYRLLVTDLDGSTATSEIVAHEACGSGAAWVAYPNPVDAGASVTVRGIEVGTAVTLADATGRTVLSLVADADAVALSLRGVPSGLYVLRAGARGARLVVR